jgi:hypothetical protein
MEAFSTSYLLRKRNLSSCVAAELDATPHCHQNAQPCAGLKFIDPVDGFSRERELPCRGSRVELCAWIGGHVEWQKGFRELCQRERDDGLCARVRGRVHRPAAIAIKNPAPGEGQSNPLIFTIK